jgi:hypothetical protein
MRGLAPNDTAGVLDPGGVRPRGPPSAFVRGHPRSRELRRDLAVALAKAGAPSLAGPHHPRSAPAGAPVARLARYAVSSNVYKARFKAHNGLLPLHRPLIRNHLAGHRVRIKRHRPIPGRAHFNMMPAGRERQRL